jgi:23S rRNA (cytosine1962-C5)-methyltransferase
VRALEGLAPRSGLLFGTLPEPLTFVEGGLRYRVDVAHGQKTGFFLDQRDNRARVRSFARGRDVLDCFCYTGGFTVAALAGGARSVLAIDSSGDALSAARANVTGNGLDAARAEWRDADVFAELRKLRDARSAFDLVVLDPPKFAPTAHHAEKATRAYKDINLLGLKLLRPGGLLATFSCSGGVSAELFQKIVAGAALDARADASIVGRFGASADHPVALDFPEGDYLKGLLVLKR